MAKFDKVLLATDFDGTLNDDRGETPKSVLDAIRYFTANGGFFTASTGRTYQGLRRYAHTDLFNAPALLSNGAMAYDFASKSVAFLYGIGDEGVPFVHALCEAFPDVSVEMYPFDETYAIHISPDTERHFTNQGIPYTVVDDPADVPRPWAKVMLGCPPGRSGDVQAYLRGVDDPSFLPTRGTFVEVLKRGVDKGSGLLRLADLLLVPHTRVYAAGDGYNDVEMLRAAAGAFVPCNASPEALAAATHVVRSNNDGAIAHAIEILDSIYT
ncbi:MAG: HAD-IIB family hydrolase [Clostridia bacterium]|nr:HAD-IIB family hydrolase [Clostridia bacterium]